MFGSIDKRKGLLFVTYDRAYVPRSAVNTRSAANADDGSVVIWNGLSLGQGGNEKMRGGDATEDRHEPVALRRSGRSSRHGVGVAVERQVPMVKQPVRPAVLSGRLCRYRPLRL